MEKQTKIFFGATVIIIVLVLGYVWYLSKPKTNTGSQVNQSGTSTTEVKTRADVVVKPAEQATASNSLKLPDGFPVDIPVETQNVTESYSAFYQKHNSTQYTVSYTSSATKSAKWDDYNTYMTKTGFVMQKDATDKTKGTLTGTMGKNSLYVVITTKDNKTLVHLTLLKQA